MTQPTPARGDGFTVSPATSDDMPEVRAHLIRIFEEDLTGYRPAVHWDVDRLAETYVDNPRHILYIARDAQSDELMGTTAVRPGGPSHPPFPRWLTDRYDSVGTAQLFRVYIARAHRRRGAARWLVEAARQFIAADGQYTVIYLHTNASVPGAEPFWRSLPTTETYDGRGNTEGWSEALHFELALHAPII